MKSLLKITFNSLLLIILLSVIFLPIGTMSLISLDEKSVVLSAQDSKKEVEQTSDSVYEAIPEEVKDIIMKLESGYQQSTSSSQPGE